MKKRRAFNWLFRLVLFILILVFGAIGALAIDESDTLAAVDLSKASVQTLTMAHHPQMARLYLAFTGGPQPAGLARSDDGGRSWQIIGAGPGAPISALAPHPKNADWLYAASNRSEADMNGGLWFSENGGQSWHRFLVGLPLGVDGLAPNVTALALDPSRPQLLYVGTQGQGAYRFGVGADYLECVLIGGAATSGSYVNKIVVDHTGQAYILTTEGLFMVAGEDWRLVDTLPDLAASLAVDPVDPQILYAGTVGYGAYRSTDGGQTWQTINAGLGWQPGVILRVSSITIDEDDPQHLALATAFGIGSHLAGGGIYETRNSGQRWTKVAESDQVIDELILAKGSIYAATEHGPLRYGEPLPPVSPLSNFSLRSLSHLSGIQVLILVMTLALAGLVLVGRLDPMPPHHRGSA
jgi:photosystem II stability/assembly factor-like uncharacterized protein